MSGSPDAAHATAVPADGAIVVMAKAPIAGFAKTRLIPALGADGAAALAERLLQHAVAQAQAAAAVLGARVELRVAPDAAHPAFAPYRSGADATLTCVPQGSGDLGARMERAFEQQLHAGRPWVLLIGTDAPALDGAVLAEAAAALVGADAVFVPALDGGYALIGLRRPLAALFHDMPWSTPAVMALSRQRLAQAGWRLAELAPLTDIDEPADLVHLPAGLMTADPMTAAPADDEAAAVEPTAAAPQRGSGPTPR